MRKSIKVLFAVLILVVVLAVALTACHGGKYKMKDFVVDFSELAKSYEVGDAVDFSKVKMYATFTDGTQQDIPLDRVTIKLDGVQIGLDELSKITETKGQKVIEIKYSDVVKSVTVEVKEKHVAVLTGVAFNADDVRKSYNVLDEVSFAGLKVYAVYDENDRRELALTDEEIAFFMDEVNVTNNLSRITDEVGDKAIKVRYKNLLSDNFFTISVSDVLDSVIVNEPENLKKSYKVGETASLAGFTATSNYRSGRKVSVDEVKFYLGTDELTSLASLTATPGTKVVTAKAVSGQVEGTKNVTIEVADIVDGVTLDTTGVTLAFVVGDVISESNFAGIKVNVDYRVGNDQQLSLMSTGVACVNAQDQAIIFENLTRASGDKVITVKVGEASDTFTVSVLPKESELKSLTITTAPTNTTYTAGENVVVSLAGLAIKGVYQDALHRADDDIAYADFEEKEVEVLYNDDPIDLANIAKVTTVGENHLTIAVVYLGQTATFELIINNNYTGLQVPATVRSRLYDEINLTNLGAKAIKNYGEEDVAYDALTFAPSNFSELKDTEATTAITVRYEAKNLEATFDLVVYDYVIEILQDPSLSATHFECEVDLTQGAVYSDFTGLKAFGYYKSDQHNWGDDKKDKWTLVELPAGFTVASVSINEPGTKKIKVTYDGIDGYLPVLYVYDVLEDIDVDESTIPAKIVKNGMVEQHLKAIRVDGIYKYKGKQRVNLLQADGETFRYGDVAFELKVGNEWQALSQSNLDQIAQEAGERQVRLSYTYRENTRQDVFVINISNGGAINAFSLPTSLVNYGQTLEDGRTYKNGESDDEIDPNNLGFEGSLYVGENEDYLVGDDNPYKFLPKAMQVVVDPDTMQGTLYELSFFKANSQIYLVDGSTETLLTATTEGNQKRWSDGVKNYVVEDFNFNKYQFTDAAVEAGKAGKKFKISVLPAAEYGYTGNAVEWTVKVVDGYNIYDSREICLLEQPSAWVHDSNWTGQYPNGGRNYWDSIKQELGLMGVKPSSIILHGDLTITKDSLPQDFWFTLDDDYEIYYKYTNEETGVTTKYRPEDVPAELGGPLERAFLWDEEWGLLQYDMRRGETFAIHGNFFSLDLSKLPLVCSFEPNGLDYPAGRDAYYMDWMSKLSFLVVEGQDVRYDSNLQWRYMHNNGGTENPTEDSAHDEHFYLENLKIRGNCSQKQVLLDESTSMKEGMADNPVYGGGIIFVKTYYCHAHLTNLNARNCFISYFARNYTVCDFTNLKSYDTYNNAVYANGETYTHLKNCHFKRSGGPLFILTQQTDDFENINTPNTEEYAQIPILISDDDCVYESYVTGQEVWFDIFAFGQVDTLKALDALPNGYFHKTFLDPSEGGKFNLVAVISQGQGYFSYQGERLDRLAESRTHEAVGTMDPTEVVPGSGVKLYADVIKGFNSYGAPCFVVGNETDGFTMCAVGQQGQNYYLQNMSQKELAQEEGYATITAFSKPYKFVSIHAGYDRQGLGIFTGWYNTAA